MRSIFYLVSFHVPEDGNSKAYGSNIEYLDANLYIVVLLMAGDKEHPTWLINCILGRINQYIH
ncbi:hypothetical protein I3843_14G104800 [Carya illinoinensis]|uniref:Uncharacterized protein n=1 Tax=Carya illinoinensis TaxID=32201 RepID=A0A922AE47_CARIL|nr:hypothetical protein I3842_14G106600 [Carya illinoinensis]KAG7947638.1 hypothetical protein I3843_14G104800 [Carya illinoinensis]KAG7947639.1 hypothetical protein I3843_14G104800 [Carya illinoinensis]